MKYAELAVRRLASLGGHHLTLFRESGSSSCNTWMSRPSHTLVSPVSSKSPLRGPSEGNLCSTSTFSTWSNRLSRLEPARFRSVYQLNGQSRHRARRGSSHPLAITRALSTSNSCRRNTAQAGGISQRWQREWRPPSNAQISTIFGSEIQPAIGNRVLRQLQRQRIDGRLDEDIEKEGVDANKLGKALAWLRQNRPIDEDAAVIRRVEREEREAEAQYLTEIKAAETWQPQDRAKVEGIYGHSVFEEASKERERRRAEKAKDIAAHPQSRVTFLVRKLSERAISDRRKESAEWVQKYRERGQIIKVFEPEKLSAAQRLLPCAIFTAGFVGMCVLFALYYKAPGGAPRLFPNLSPATATILAICGANVALFIAWRLPFCWRKLNQYFLIIVALPKPLSLLGSTFSHQTVLHLLVNMMFLWVIGPKCIFVPFPTAYLKLTEKVHQQIGRENFVPLYLSCGVFASFLSLSRAVFARNMLQTSLGASGSITGIMAAWLCLNPDAKFTFVFLSDDWSPSLPSGLILSVLILLEFVDAFKGVIRVDHFAHLGGYFAGILGAQALKYRLAAEKNERGRKGQR